MKKTVITFSMILMASYCFGQDIDKRALEIMQTSFDKLAAMATINYSIKKVDAAIRVENPLSVENTTVKGMIKKNSYWHILFEDKNQWLIKGDTLYKKQATNSSSISYTTDWEDHSVAEFSAYNILGRERPKLREDIASLKFVQDTAKGKYYVMDLVWKKKNYGTDEVIDVLHYNKYVIDKKSLLPLKRIQYGKSLLSGKEAIDIYDFTLNINQSHQDTLSTAAFFDLRLEKEKNDLPETIKAGAMAPLFSATEVRTEKQGNLKDLKGKVVLLDFWYMSCMPCRILTPKIQKIHEKFKGKDLAVIGLNISDHSAKDITDFLDERKINFPQYYKAISLANYQLYAYPTIIVIGKDGRIKLVEVGEGSDTVQKLEKTIELELQKL